MLKIIHVINFCVVTWFRSIHEIFLTIDDYNMDERLESSYRLVCYRVSDLCVQAYSLIIAV